MSRANTDLIFETVQQRPYGLPSGSWVMTQVWANLLFAHWPVDAAELRRLVPEPLEIDIFEGSAWVAVVPFAMRNVRPRYLPAVPWLSNFLELNVRTYVHHNGKPGVFFFSLDASNPVAVEIARSWYHLPYMHATMSLIEIRDGTITYESRRTDSRAKTGVFKAQYKPQAPVSFAKPGSLEQWLTDRYCLYTKKDQTLIIGEIHHAQWPLQRAWASIEENTMLQAAGFKNPESEPLLHFAKELTTFEWLPQPATK